MRILQVSFSNINSLVGHWRIDLNHPDYLSDGIFAITGPTGAGKTTILDAICVALYGTTPRLGRLGKGTNELMSRQSGQCHAEVVFETAAGRFVSHWAQHRARRRADGDLQAPRHEVSRVSGEILSSSIKESAGLILELTGMGFEQFSRSMMLAQGAFAAFLQAKSDDRAPILEQITGSEIYSQISVMAHECRGQQRARLDELESELQGTRLLDDVTREQIELEIARLGDEVLDKTTQIRTVQDKRQILQQMAALQSQIKANQLEREHLNQGLEAFAPERARLQAAKRALEIAPEHRALQIAQADQARDRQVLVSSQTDLPLLSQALQVAQTSVAHGEDELRRCQTQYADMQPVIDQTRKLDAELLALSTSIGKADRSHKQLSEDLRVLGDQARKTSASQVDVAGQLSSLGARAKHHANDARLVSELSALSARLATLQESDSQIREGLRQVQALELDQSKVCKAKDAIAGQLTTEQDAFDATKRTVEQTSQSLEAALAGHSLSYWQNLHTRLLAQTSQLEQAIQTLSQKSDLEQRGERNHVKVAEIEKQLAADDQSLQHKTRESALLAQQVQALQQQITLEQRIERYEQARAHLHDGQPCPLCGALEHPFASEGTPVPGQTQREHDLAKAQQNALEQELMSLKIALTSQQRLRQQINEDLATDSIALDALRDRLNEQLAVLGGIPSGNTQTIQQALAQNQVSLVQQVAESSRKLAQAQRIADDLQSHRLSLEQRRQTLERTQSAAVTVAHEEKMVRHRHEQASAALESQKSRRNALVRELAAELAGFSVAQQMLDDVPAVLAEINVRRDRWVDLQQQLQQAQQQSDQLQQAAQFHAQRIAGRQAEIAELDRQLGEMRELHATISSQRETLLERRDPDQVQKLLLQSVDAARQSLDQARADWQQRQAAHQQLSDRIAQLSRDIQERALTLESLGAQFALRLQRAGFEHEQAYLQACMPDEQRHSLEQQHTQLYEQQTRIEAARLDLAGREGELVARIDPADNETELGERIVLLEREQQTFLQALGGLRQRIADDENARAQHASKLELIAAQRREFERWDQLHTLIGSADGKKFRIFAQGLTFEIVIGHANRQLQRMTDRYVLVRSTQEPLELNVVDLYQAAEVRTTKNLSGGESFLVSLALALGLSKMASKNVRVDSLFLDEGFGTLDEDALDTALQTLSSLQQEGKLIGVISHIQALKDRIGTQIQVTPLRGGRSVLSGPGCERGPD